MTEMENMGNALYDVADAIEYLAEKMGDIPEESLFKMKMVYDNALHPMYWIAKEMTPDVALNAGKLVDEAERYAVTQATMKNFAEDAFAQMVVAQAKAAQAQAEAQKAAAENGGEGGDGPRDVVLMLNEREFGRAVEVFMNKRINLSMS